MKKSAQYSPEVRERAVRMVLDHQKDYGSQRGAIVGIGAKVSSSSTTDFVLDALEHALHARRPAQTA